MVRVGIVGIGFMGMVHYLNYQRLRGVRVVAICTRNERRRAGDWRNIRGSFGPAGTRVDLSQVKAYSDVDQLLSDESIDLVDVTLPPALHSHVSIQALEAGKHVFCEKPMSLTTSACSSMLKAASSTERLLMVGHILPFFPEYAWALRTVKSGRYGRILGGEFKRVIADPRRSKDYWCPVQTGGPMFDLHVHEAHFIRLLCGMPKSIVTRGSTNNKMAKYWHSLFDFGASHGIIEVTTGVVDQQARSFLHGFEIRLERATLVFEFAIANGIGRYLCPPTILNSQGRAEPVILPEPDPMNALQYELREVTRGICVGNPSKALNGEIARDAVRLCERQMNCLLK